MGGGNKNILLHSIKTVERLSYAHSTELVCQVTEIVLIRVSHGTTMSNV